MNSGQIYLNEDIINKIYDKLEIKDKIIFAYINKYTYDIYININKNLIYNYLNNYKIFYKLINIYKYSFNELMNIYIYCINNIQYIEEYGLNGRINKYFDLRFLFELIMIDKNLVNHKIDNKNNILHNLLYDIKYSYYLSRYETIVKINNKPHLRSLHRCFKPKCKNWIYLY